MTVTFKRRNIVNKISDLGCLLLKTYKIDYQIIHRKVFSRTKSGISNETRYQAFVTYIDTYNSPEQDWQRELNVINMILRMASTGENIILSEINYLEKLYIKYNRLHNGMHT